MKYFLQREGREYGPYSLEDLKRYKAENRIGPNDMVRREDSQQWEPWRQVLDAPTQPATPSFTPPPAGGGFGAPQQPSGFGGQPPFGGSQPSSFGQQPSQGGFSNQPQFTPQTPEQGFGYGGGSQGGFGGSSQPGGFGGGYGNSPAPQQDPYGGGYGQPGGFGQPGGYGQPGGFGQQPGAVGPMPPDMQWWMVLVLSLVTCGIFGLYWIFKQAGFVQRIDPNSNAKKLYIIGLVLNFGGSFLGGLITGFAVASRNEGLIGLSFIGNIISLVGTVCLIMGHFSMRKSIHEYYTNVEPMGINLMDTMGGVMTFFFNTLFFQYHFFNIATRKKALGHQ
jgi:hypothetical protein